MVNRVSSGPAGSPAKTVGAILLAAGLALALACSPRTPYAPQSGDIVFQTSTSTQSEAIQRATRSPWSHMGIVLVANDRALVLEAVEPVRLTPLERWIARGRGRHFVAKRLADAAETLTPGTLRRMRAVGRRFLGRHYDLAFRWDDRRLYCSELVWKIYERGAGIQLCPLQRMGDFDLSDPVVARMVRERWGGPPPPGEPVVSPAAIFHSPVLVTVAKQ